MPNRVVPLRELGVTPARTEIRDNAVHGLEVQIGRRKHRVPERIVLSQCFFLFEIRTQRRVLNKKREVLFPLRSNPLIDCFVSHLVGLLPLKSSKDDGPHQTQRNKEFQISQNKLLSGAIFTARFWRSRNQPCRLCSSPPILDKHMNPPIV